MHTNQKNDSNKALIPQKICAFNDAWTQWLQGSKFPIAFFGDSTVDGVNTTGWVANTIGMDSTSPNTFSKNLEELLREATQNSILRIYNSGFSGTNASWAVTILEEQFGGGSAYQDAQMIGIGFGINDRLLYPNEKAYRDGFKGSIEKIINWCYSKNIQPFLLTTQAIVEPGANTEYAADYPMRTSEHIACIANEVKKELAEAYGLQIIDMNEYTERFLQYSSISAQRIISDRLHFGDIGHRYEAGVLFSCLSPRTIVVDGYTKIDYSSQKIKNSVPDDWLSMPEVLTDSFKVYVDCAKADSTDMMIMSAWVFLNAKRKLTLKAYKTISPDTYVKLNGVIKSLIGAETVIDHLDQGLYFLQVFTGASSKADFKGFILE
ncbi:SGNH/GDSL hydrolase family protein [Paenibacillus eucommiae]|uniref:Lysophospholipase L1-like esterase n=1 Tax=Paenibacillus eucommiae TaxID=1355755 RepID=A0ABS4IQM1_9BACL|nr:GDSL-type esterase/lipase family protein [Paenibacillus eucommiae]MBP1989186.1 lysophospholipase L1-like esterase [Paenibacillus eucommiae]